MKPPISLQKISNAFNQRIFRPHNEHVDRINKKKFRYTFKIGNGYIHILRNFFRPCISRRNK